MLSAILKNLLAHPATHGMGVDDPRIPELQRRILWEKSYLRQLYEEWYSNIAAVLPAGKGPVLELGSGPGFLKDFVPKLITSDIIFCPEIGVVLDGERLPVADGALGGIVMTNVLHHLCQPRLFFAEAVRSLQQGGVVVMIEPWITPWSRLVYSRLHHEPFQPKAETWASSHDGPLSGANSAFPWIVFERDRAKFQKEFPELQIRCIELSMPFRYLASGGVSLRSFMPGWAFGLSRRIENSLRPYMKTWAMFALIRLVKADTTHWQR